MATVSNVTLPGSSKTDERRRLLGGRDDPVMEEDRMEDDRMEDLVMVVMVRTSRDEELTYTLPSHSRTVPFLLSDKTVLELFEIQTYAWARWIWAQF